MKREKKQLSPYFASVNYDPAQDSGQDRLEFSKKFLTLPKVIKYGFLDKNTENSIGEISKKYNISDPKNIGEVSRMVRGFFLDGKGEGDWQESAKSKLQIEEGRIGDFIADIKKVNSRVRELGENTLLESVEKLPIIPALKKYEELGDQDITDNQIEIEIGNTKEFVNPNIKNWLEDYIQNKGAQAHSNLERSDYLYKSKNTEELSTEERNKLSLLITSYDKDDLLAIEKEQQEVLFDDTLDVLSQINDKKNTSDPKGSGDDKKDSFGPIELASTSNEIKQEEDEQKDQKKDEVSKKSHEINWYGTNPFDGLEKIDSKTQPQQEQKSQLVKMGTRKNDQPTKHVVDLKNSQ